MNIKEIQSLVDLVVSSGVSEVTLKNGERKLTIRRPALETVAPEVIQSIAYEMEEPSSIDEQSLVVSDATSTVTAPMVGIFHYASPPVGVGTKVEEGMVIGIIESMKLMNEVHAISSGYIHSISIEAGMAVEYGTPLFVVGALSPSLSSEISE